MIGSTVGQSINSTMTGLSILYSKVFWHSMTTGGDVVVYKYFLYVNLISEEFVFRKQYLLVNVYDFIDLMLIFIMNVCLVVSITKRRSDL